MIYMSITHALMAFFLQCFAQCATDVFAQKNFAKDIFNSKICYRIDSLVPVIGPRVVQFQGVIMLVISNRPRVLRSSNFEVTLMITP